MWTLHAFAASTATRFYFMQLSRSTSHRLSSGALGESRRSWRCWDCRVVRASDGGSCWILKVSGQLLEADGRVDDIAQYRFSRRLVATKIGVHRFRQERLAECAIRCARLYTVSRNALVSAICHAPSHSCGVCTRPTPVARLRSRRLAASLHFRPAESRARAVLAEVHSIPGPMSILSS